MRYPSRPASVLLAALLALAVPLPASPAEPAATTKRPISETDIFGFVWIADPQISPDGRQVAFVRVTVDEKREGYETALWIVPADGSEPARALTRGPRDLSPRWSPDGTRLVFVRSPEKDGKPQPPQLHLLSLVGGEPQVLTDIPQGAGSPVWSPDGRTIAFTASANDQDLAQWAWKKEKEKEEGAKEGEERVSDVRVITRAVFRLDGQGYLDPTRPSHLWTVEVPRPGDGAALPLPRQITRGEFAEEQPVWSPDGAWLYFRSRRVEDALDDDADLWVVPAGGGEMRRVADIQGGIDAFAVSPDGRRIAFIGSAEAEPLRSYDQPDLFVVDTAAGGTPRNLTTGYDFDIGRPLTGDQKAPRGERPLAPVWSADGRTLLVTASERGRANLLRVDAATGKVSPLTAGDQEVVCYTASRDGSRLALVLSNATLINDLHVLEAATGRMRPVVQPNAELFAQIALSAPEEITYQSFDGRPIQAWVQKPVDFDPAQKYPLILNIHGGPHAAYGWTFDHEFHWLAARGYVVLYPNPRGSSAYGQEFGNVIQYRFPGDDAKDLLAGVDELVRRGSVDPKRLGVTGGSGGGILTNWILTQTDRFAAAVSQRSIADWTSFWYTADFALFRPYWFRGAPWEQPEDFAARSPITHVANIKTPLMLIEGEADQRTPSTAGGEMMFRALEYLKRPVVMVRFPGETHELSRSGGPWHRVERLQHIVAWFDKYLLGKGGEQYDVD